MDYLTAAGTRVSSSVLRMVPLRQESIPALLGLGEHCGIFWRFAKSCQQRIKLQVVISTYQALQLLCIVSAAILLGDVAWEPR